MSVGRISPAQVNGRQWMVRLKAANHDWRCVQFAVEFLPTLAAEKAE